MQGGSPQASPCSDYSGFLNTGVVTGALSSSDEPPIHNMWLPRSNRIFSFGNPRAILNVLGGQSVQRVGATSIDSSGGNTVSDQDGTIVDTVNWTAPQTVVAAAAPGARRKLRTLLGVGL